jgi:predicted Zn finger-like uncharacterized protein
MLIVCPNCASSYGVDMASLRPAKGRTRQVRCSRCGFVWRAELSPAEKLMVVADAVLPVRRAMLAAAQAAADAARSTLPHLRRATTILAEELATAGARPDPAPISGVAAPPKPPMTKRLRAAWSGAVEGVAAMPIKVLASLARWRPSWRVSWRPSFRLSWPAMPSWSIASLLFSLKTWRPSPSHLLVLGLALTDAAIINCRGDIVWAMPQTDPFFAALGLPVRPAGIQLERLTTAAERHDGEPVLIVKGEIGNNASKAQDVPDLVFAIRNAERQEIYSWTAAPARRALSGGETLLFQSELALPPADTREVVVRFLDRDNSL